MRKLIVELLKKHYDSIVTAWLEKLLQTFPDKFTESQLQTFVESSIQILIEVVEKAQYNLADQYLIDAYNLFSEHDLNLLEVSQVFSMGRNALLNNLQKEPKEKIEPVILLGFIDEIIEQMYARYSMLHQNAKMKELESDRTRLENKLEMNQKYLRNILHTSESAIAVIDNNEKFQSWSKGAERIFGYTEKEVIGNQSSLLMPDGEKYRNELKYIIESIKNSEEINIVDTERRKKDGVVIPVQLTVAKLPSKDGEYSGRTIIIRDQSQVKQLQQQIDQSEKLAVIGQLAAGVAHEIGNPLASISSMVQVIQRKNKDDVLNEQLIIIKENIDRISKIVKELVDFSRPPSYEKVTIQIADIIKTAVGIVKYDKRVKKVNFETDYDTDLPLIRIVPDQLLQVFVNILINALDAIQGNGTIKVKSYHDDKYIFVKISDNGCGMDVNVINKIFDPFFTTKDVGKGTGLGLSVSYSIVKKINGEIFVDSDVNEGSTFTVKLPISKN